MKLSDWTTLLTHPEVGERICEAAGCTWRSRFKELRWSRWDPSDITREGEVLGRWEQAALAFGTLAVLAEMDYPQVCEDRGKWRVVFDFTDPQPKWCDTLPAAVLAAALRVFGGGA